MLSRRPHKRLASLLATLMLVFGLHTAARAQFRIAPIQPDQVGDTITCFTGGNREVLTPDRRQIHRSTRAFAPDNVETQRLIDEVAPHTALRINVHTVPVTDPINVQICPSEGGRHFIVYSPAWVLRIYNETRNKWALYAIIAHEIGHYVLSHDRTSVGSEPLLELAADEYAGRILALMGASLADAQAVYKSELMIHLGSSTHPPAAERLAAVRRGWEKGRAGNPQYSYALRGTIQYLPHGSNTPTTYRVDETTTEHALPRFKNLYGRFQSVDLEVTQFTNGNRCASGAMGNSPHQHMHPPGLADDGDSLEVHINKHSVGSRGTPGPYFKGGWQGKVIDGGTSGSMYMEIFLEPSMACESR
jgi:hypothetical protein